MNRDARRRKLREKNARRNAKTVHKLICRQQEEARQSILTQILTPEARDRCTCYFSMLVIKIKLVKPEKVAGIENALIQAAQQGKLRNRVSEQELVSMLETQSQTQTKVTVLNE